MGPEAARARIDAVYRLERARLIGGLARFAGDISAAEDHAQDALLAALDAWPRTGVPRNPGAWLMAAGKRRAIDRMRHEGMRARKLAALSPEGGDEATARDAGMGDELLALMFAACHPAIAPEAQAALTLRLIGGLTTDEIARAFLIPEATAAQRIVRAKAALSRLGERFAVPEGPERRERLGAVLAVLYLIFNEGYAATSGAALVRPDLCAEARRYGRILAALMPGEAEVWGLLALMELQSSRLGARTDAAGLPVPVTRQDRTRWDRLMIRRGLAALARAEALGGGDGPYALQAAIAAEHARAPDGAATGWGAIAALYDRLAAAVPTPVVALNRAVAHGMAFGPERALALIDGAEGMAALRDYAPLAAARGDALFRLGRRQEARAAFLRAAELSGNDAERAYLAARAEECGG
jgi:predicted RNA polymerase sigma factor